MLSDLIKQQHRHFGIAYDGPSASLSDEEEKFRMAAMLEELTEFVLAKDVEEKYDALLDLIVFAAGTLERMGLEIDAGLREVVKANLEKELGPGTKRGGFQLDLIKPSGWQPPNLKPLLRRNNNDS